MLTPSSSKNCSKEQTTGASSSRTTKEQSGLSSVLSQSSAIGTMMQMQRMFGNRAVAGLLQRRSLASAHAAAGSSKPVQMAKSRVRVDDNLLNYLRQLIIHEFVPLNADKQSLPVTKEILPQPVLSLPGLLPSEAVPPVKLPVKQEGPQGAKREASPSKPLNHKRKLDEMYPPEEEQAVNKDILAPVSSTTGSASGLEPGSSKPEEAIVPKESFQKKLRLHSEKALLHEASGSAKHKPLLKDTDYDLKRFMKLLRSLFEEAMTEFLGSTPRPDSIDTSLGALKTLWEYVRLHQLDPETESDEAEEEEADKEQPQLDKENKGIAEEQAEKGAEEEQEDDDQEQEADQGGQDDDEIVSKLKITPHTQSPYTHESRIAFFNLGESVLPVGTYADIQENLTALFHALPHLENAGSILLRLVASPSFAAFNAILDGIPVKQLKTRNADKEDGEQSRAVLRDKIWRIAQLWRLEAGRRLAGGVMNTILIERAIEQGNISVADAVELLTERNVMNFEGASGKSDGYQFLYGKQSKLDASRTIIHELMGNETGHKALLDVKEALREFHARLYSNKKKKEAAPSLDDAAASLEEVWEENATKTYARKVNREGMDQRGDRMEFNRHVSQALADDPNWLLIQKWPEYLRLANAFKQLMQAHYATKSKGMEIDIEEDDKKPKAAKPIAFTEFETWLINKAAAQGHLRVLEQEMFKHETFIEMFEANRHADKATALKHVANLRKGLEMTSEESHPFHQLAIHSTQTSSMLDKGFGKYKNIHREIFQVVGSIYKLDKNHLETALKIMKKSDGKSKETNESVKKRFTEKNTLLQKEAGRFVRYPAFTGNPHRENLVKLLEEFSVLANQVDEQADELFKRRKPKWLDYDKSLTKFESAFSRLGGLKRVYQIIETVRSFPMGIMNLMVSEADDLPSAATFNQYNTMSDVDATSKPHLQTKKVVSILQNVTWTKDKPTHYLINTILQQLADWSQEKEAAVTEGNREKVKALVKQFLGLMYQSDTYAELDTEQIEKKNSMEDNVRLYFQTLLTLMKRQLDMGNAAEFNNYLSRFYDDAEKLQHRKYMESMMKEHQPRVNELLSSMSMEKGKEMQQRALYGKGERSKPSPDISPPAVEGEFRLLRRGILASDAFLRWNTVADNNCAFNGFGLSLIALIRQGALSQETVLNRLNAFVPNTVSQEALQQLIAAGGPAIDQGLRHASRDLQIRFEPVIRSLAVAALRNNQGLLDTIRVDLLATLENRVRAANALAAEGAGGDLFNDPDSPVNVHLNTVVTQAVEEFRAAELRLVGAEPAQLAARLEAFLAVKKRELTAWFNREGMTAYLNYMAGDQVWGGAPELHALAQHFGIHLATVTPFGLDLGAGQAGEAEMNYRYTDREGTEHVVDQGRGIELTEAEVTILRSVDVIEGTPVNPEHPAIHFRLLNRTQVIEALQGRDGALIRKFLALYDQFYRYRITDRESGAVVRDIAPNEMVVGEDDEVSFTNAEAHILTGANLIHDPQTLDGRIVFRGGIDPATIRESLRANAELQAKFLQLYEARLPKPVIMGMVNRNSIHWSSFSTADGRFNLTG
ncbi:OTU domain-containing protein [Paenibacillus sp. y28]|uniref:OTU domain-containing protein n=1 Tax=Paenibacillus sp. y28 TaxID=3129110 RepID=UPI00301826D3